MRSRCGIIASGVLAGLLTASGAASAQTYLWTGTNGSLWNDAGNWSNAPGFPNSSLHQANVAAAGSAQFGVPPILNQNILLGDLSISNSGDVFNGLFTNHVLTVRGKTSVVNNNSSLSIANGPSSLDFNTDELDVFFTGQGTNEGLILLGGSVVQINDEATVNATGVVQGSGTIQLNQLATRFTLGGLLRVPSGQTMVLTKLAGPGELDWNGPFGVGTSAIEVAAGGSLGIRLPPTAPFRGSMDIDGSLVVDSSTAGPEWTNEGTIRLDGGRIVNSAFRNRGAVTTTGDVTLQIGTTFETGSSLAINGGTVSLIALGADFFDDGVTFTGNGTLLFRSVLALGDNDLGDITLRNEGILALVGDPSDPTGFAPQVVAARALDTVRPGSELAFVLAGDGGVPGTDFSQLNLDLTTAIDGRLRLVALGSAVGSFTPDVGDQFTVLTSAGAVTGQFGDFVSEINLPTGRVWSVTYNPSSIVVSVVAGLAGDYNDSGLVEQGDLNLVLNNWGDDVRVTGVPVGWINDLPFGLIDQRELNQVLNNWGDSAAPAFDGSRLPEPAAAPLLLLVALVGTGWRSCRSPATNGPARRRP